MELKFKPELRPCIINGVGKGIFHCWEQYAEPIAPGLTIGSHPGGQISRVNGIVEIESGHVIRVNLSSIRFIDNKMAGYDFTDYVLFRRLLGRTLHSSKRSYCDCER